jgi:hypothetical protein
LKSQGFKLILPPFKYFLAELWQHISKQGDDDMALNNLSPQEIKEFGEMWGDVLLPTLPLEKRLSGANPSEVMNHFKPEQRLRGLKPEERFIGLKPEERLAGLSTEEIEELLKKLKQQKKDN